MKTYTTTRMVMTRVGPRHVVWTPERYEAPMKYEVGDRVSVVSFSAIGRDNGTIREIRPAFGDALQFGLEAVVFLDKGWATVVGYEFLSEPVKGRVP